MAVLKKPRGSYQHGNLREALVRGALELVGERGIHGFSLAEAARRAGVSAAAPYRHFRDRDDLLAAIATEAYVDLGTLLSAAAAEHAKRPVDAIGAMAAAYVTFAFERRAEFAILFEAGLDKRRFPELEKAGIRVLEALAVVATRLTGGDAERAARLVLETAATAHGFAVFGLSGTLRDHGIDDTTAPRLAAASAGELAAAARRNSRSRPTFSRA